MSSETQSLCATTEDFIEKYRENLLDFEKCKILCEKLSKEKISLLSQLNTQDDSSEAAQWINKAFSLSEVSQTLLNDSSTLTEQIDASLSDFDAIRKEVQGKLDDLYFLQTKVQYLNVIRHVERLIEQLEKESLGKDDEKCITIYLNICEIYHILRNCTSATILLDYLRETIKYWHEVLKTKLVSDLDETLKAIKWPFVSANFSLLSPTQANIQRLQIIVEYLLEIELPDDLIESAYNSGILADFAPLCLPLSCLVAPLRKRFVYHFYGTRQTNRVDKPEWYFTQILSWIRDHIDFVEKWIQPVIDKLGMHHIDAKLEFMRGLVQLAVEKLNAEMPNFRYDDFTFSHTIDEGLGFHKELRDSYFYPSTQPSILAVLTQGSVLSQWLKMERKFALEKMDAMINADAFEPLNSDESEHKVTICADTFVTLLQTITERYEALPQPGHRLQFLELQLELLENFRIRLLQLVNAESGDLIESKMGLIANTIYYIENVLLDWGATLHYLSLFYYKNQMENLQNKCNGLNESRNLQNSSPDAEFESETVFADTLSLYRHMREDLLFTLGEYTLRQAKSRSKYYCVENWSTMISSKDARTLSLTPSACPMFEVLGKRLYQLQKSLTVKLFTIVWRYIAEQMDGFLFEDLILNNRFNEGGALQLKFDLTRNLFPLFAQFSEKPENYFIRLKESCDLLNISKGSAVLLKETLVALEGATGVEDRRPQALKEVGVCNCTPEMAVNILNRRTDLRYLV